MCHRSVTVIMPNREAGEQVLNEVKLQLFEVVNISMYDFINLGGNFFALLCC